MTKEEWQGAKKHHFEKPRCGVCGAPLAAARPRPAAVTVATSEPLCVACGRGFQELKAQFEIDRLTDEYLTAKQHARMEKTS